MQTEKRTEVRTRHISTSHFSHINATRDQKINSINSLTLFDAHCFHMGTAIKHPVSDRVKPSFVIFDIRAL